jgi:hypothetical protein
MQQATIHSPGESGSSGNPRNLKTAPVTPKMRIMRKNSGMKVESICFPPGGKIKATVFTNTHTGSVGPEPGVGYGWPVDGKGHHMKRNRLMKIFRSAT